MEEGKEMEGHGRGEGDGVHGRGEGDGRSWKRIRR